MRPNPVTIHWKAIGSRLLAIVLLAFLATSPAHSDEGALWQALRDGRAFAMMRHELAPGNGDPSNFDVNDCSTQRNLNDVGREQSRRTGKRFRANGIAMARVVSSAWCRCQETARLLGLGTVETLPALNSFYETMERREQQTKALRAWLQANQPNGPLVLVTHQVNISALTGRYTSSGEMIIVRWDKDGRIAVLGSL